MATLELHFERRPHAVLTQTRCDHRGKTVGTNVHTDEEHVQWRGGVMAHTWLLLHWATWARGPDNDGASDPPAVAAQNKTMAGSVRQNLEKPLKWRERVFGDLSVTDLIRVRQCQGRKELYLNTALLDPRQIRVFADGAPVDSPDELQVLEDDIGTQWKGSRRNDVPEARRRARQVFADVQAHPDEMPRLADLVSDFAEQRVEDLAPEVVILLGQAMRVELVVDFGRCLERSVADFEVLSDECRRPPEEVAQVSRIATGMLDRFADWGERVRDRARHWPELRDLATAAAEDVQPKAKATLDYLAEVQQAQRPTPDVAEASLEKVAQLAAEMRDSLRDFKGKLIAASNEANQRLRAITEAAGAILGAEN